MILRITHQEFVALAAVEQDRRCRRDRLAMELVAAQTRELQPLPKTGRVRIPNEKREFWIEHLIETNTDRVYVAGKRNIMVIRSPHSGRQPLCRDNLGGSNPEILHD